MTAEPAPARPERSPRERMVRSAAQLIRVQGVAATGLRQVVEHAHAPRGSLQHYFPGGKDQLVAEALAASGRAAARQVARHAERVRPRTPGALFAALAREWRTLLADGGFAPGCPLVAAAADAAATSDELREAVRGAFAEWQRPVEEALAGMGVTRARRTRLALVMISALEGAVVLARARRDLAPLDAVVAELRPLLDGAAPHPARRPSVRGRPGPGAR